MPELEAAQVKSGEAERGALAAAAEDGARAAAAANAALRARERALAAAEAALAHERGLRAHRAAVAQAGALAGACLVRGPTRAGAARRDRGADAAPERARRAACTPACGAHWTAPCRQTPANRASAQCATRPPQQGGACWRIGFRRPM